MQQKKFTKHFFSLLATLFLLLSFAAGCAPSGSSSEQISVTVKITAPQKEIINEEIKIDKENATAGKAFLQACQSKKLAYTHEDGFYDNFDGIASNDSEGWIFLCNGEPASTGADTFEVSAGDTVEFIYALYSDYFDF